MEPRLMDEYLRSLALLAQLPNVDVVSPALDAS